MAFAQQVLYYLDLPDLETAIKIIIRLVVAFIVGAAIGLERERFFKEVKKMKAAGFRTYTLVCFGSCLFGIASIYGFPSTGMNVDPGRIAAQVVTGVGFLGAGAILKYHGEVRGLTTAAGLWAAAALGLLISSQMFVIGIIAALFVYVALHFHSLFPRWLAKRAQSDRGLPEEPEDR